MSKGSFDTTNQGIVKGYMVTTAGTDFTSTRWNNAFAKLDKISCSSVNVWCGDTNNPLITITKPGTGTLTAPKGTALIDCRSDPPLKASDESPFRFKDRIPIGGDIGQSNQKIFSTALNILKSAKITDNPALNVVFYDSGGHQRAPEMCMRYIDYLLNSNNSALLGKQLVYFLDGGMEAYVKQFSTSTYVEAWPIKKAGN